MVRVNYRGIAVDYLVNTSEGAIANLSPSSNIGIRVGCNTINYTPVDYAIDPQDTIKTDVNSLANCELTDCI